MIIHTPFILFEGIGKSIPFNSFLDFSTLSDLKMHFECAQIAGNCLSGSKILISSIHVVIRSK